MSTSIDLRKAHAHYVRGDLNIVLSWINDSRAMFLIPVHRAKAPWFVIPEQAAFEWNDQDPANRVDLVYRAGKACDVLGFEPNMPNVNRIIGLVNNFMQELVRMPSAQPPEKTAGTYGRMQLKADGQVIAEEDIRLEKEGVAYV
jgi:hypothetical protein